MAQGYYIKCRLILDTNGSLKNSVLPFKGFNGYVCHVINNGCPKRNEDKFSFGRISRAPANFITARSADLKCSGRWGGILRVGAAGVREGRVKEEEEETPRSPHPTYPTAIYSRLPEVSQQHHLDPHAPPHQPSPELESSLVDSLPSPHSPSRQRAGVTHSETGIRQVWPKAQQRAMALLLDGSPVAAAYFCLLRRRFKRRRKRRSERKGTPNCHPSHFLWVSQ